MKTCATCKHYAPIGKPGLPGHETHGLCEKIGSDSIGAGSAFHAHTAAVMVGYEADVELSVKGSFGCVLHEKKL